MRFKVGDKVRIRKDLKEGNDFKVYVTDDMEELAGKIVTIIDAWENCGANYSINEDTNKYTWSEDMFEVLARPTKEELFKMPIGTKIITNDQENNTFVFDGVDSFYGNTRYLKDDEINEDLTVIDKYCGTKIIEIQEPTYNTIYKADDEVKEMTIAEIEKELGYPIKVVKEEE